MDLLIIALALIVQRAGDWRLHRVNTAVLNEHGAKWAVTFWTRLWFWGEISILLFILCESFFLRSRQAGWLMAIGIVIWLASVALRYWVRQALGVMWTLDIGVVPGAAKITSGPYRWIAHPDYLGRVLEVVGVCIVLQAYLGGLAYLGLLMVVLPPTLILERRQLEFLS